MPLLVELEVTELVVSQKVELNGRCLTAPLSSVVAEIVPSLTVEGCPNVIFKVSVFNSDAENLAFRTVALMFGGFLAK